MGASAITYFCENGHIVLDVPHHYIAEDPDKCSQCGSTNIRFEMEWGDLDYGLPRVPFAPLRTERKKKIIDVDIPIYDVSGLFKKKARHYVLVRVNAEDPEEAQAIVAEAIEDYSGIVDDGPDLIIVAVGYRNPEGTLVGIE